MYSPPPDMPPASGPPPPDSPPPLSVPPIAVSGNPPSATYPPPDSSPPESPPPDTPPPTPPPAAPVRCAALACLVWCLPGLSIWQTVCLHCNVMSDCSGHSIITCQLEALPAPIMQPTSGSSMAAGVMWHPLFKHATTTRKGFCTGMRPVQTPSKMVHR